MSTDIIDVPPTALVKPERSAVLLTPVMDVQTALARLKNFQEFCNEYLDESKDGGEDGGDYGIVPGTKKKMLFKSGVEKLAEMYGLYDEYVIIGQVEDWDRGLFDYTIRCTLRSRKDDSIVGSGLGSCSTYESRYRWRDQQRRCPACHQATVIKGRKEFGGGWLCFAKRGGCGGKWPDGSPEIESQVIGRVENPDIVDAKNTVLKMSKLRSKRDAVIGVTRSSGIFSQDIDPPPPSADEKPTVQVPNVAPVRPTVVAENKVISEAQQRRLWAIAKRSKWTEPQVKHWLDQTYHYTSTSDILRSDYDAICQTLELTPLASATDTMPTEDEIFS